MINSLKVRATALGRFMGRASSSSRGGNSTNDLADTEQGQISACFQAAFGETYWDSDVIRFKLKNQFNISLIGNSGVGKTSVAYILTGAKFNLFDVSRDPAQPYSHRMPLEKGVYIVDHFGFPFKGHETLNYLESHTDLLLFLVDSSRMRIDDDNDRLTFSESKELGIPFAVVANKVDMLSNNMLSQFIKGSKRWLGRTPLPISAADGTGIGDLRKFITKSKRMYA
jgi:GTP-binding protein EngB required for normal cell division